MAIKAEPCTLRFSAFKLVMLVSAFIAWEAVPVSNAASRWTPAALNVFLTGRGGEKDASDSIPALWHYSGRLRDPNAGTLIARVEGIEASRYIGTDGGSEGLKAIQDSNTDCVAIGTTLCNKFFVWVEEDGHTPLKRFRVNPTSKSRRVPAYQACCQAITYALNPSGRVAVWTEWGDGRLVSAESTAESAVGDADGITARKKYSVNWPWKRKQRGTPLVLSMDFDVISGKKPVEQQRRGLGKWVSFGPSSSPKYGCKETYKYELNNDDESEEHTISYHRLGECPSWYGPGRMCTLDMLARRVPSLKEIPKELRDACTAVVPCFFHVARNVSELKASEQAFRVEQRVNDPWWNLWQYI